MASRPCFFGGKKRPLGLLRPLMVAFGTHLTFQTVSLPRPGCVRVWKLARWVRATLEVICRRAVLGRLGGRDLGRCSFLRSLPVDFQWLTSSLIHPISERDCPKRGPSNAPKVDSDVMTRPKWVETSLLGAL